MSNVLTIYCHGTGGSRKKGANKGEIVNIFGNNAMGKEGVDFLITEGVGKMGAPHKSLYVHSTTGSHLQETVPSKVRIQDNLKKAAGMGSKILQHLGEDTVMQASGVGVDENVASVLNRITEMYRNGKAPTVINMMGWSRGAVTCIRIAHFLNLVPELSKIPINIFAVDPVAGQGHDTEADAHTLGGNVKHYVGTLSVHENRGAFQPMEYNLLRINGCRRAVILPMPGIHSDTAKFYNASGKITFHLCAKFLDFHGTVLHEGIKRFALPNNLAWIFHEGGIGERQKAA